MKLLDGINMKLIDGSNYRLDTIREEISGFEDKPEGITQNVAQRKKK